MQGSNEYIDTTIQSQRGPIELRKCYIDDTVYEYGTNKILRIRDIIESQPGIVFEVKYSDGRKSYHMSDDLIYTGINIMRLSEVIKHMGLCGHIQQYPIEYHEITKPLFPDPYFAGALIAYGDYDDKYINLPTKINWQNPYIQEQYLMTTTIDSKSNKVYFHYRGTKKLVKWSHLFKQKEFYPVSKKLTDPLIPYEYTRASINNRQQFIRGIFDSGYSSEISPDNIGIDSDHEYLLKQIQKMLYSLGVLSTIKYDPSSHRYDYRLDIVGPLENYPGFFYDIKHIERMIYNNNMHVKVNRDFKFKIVSITKHGTGYMSNLVLDKPNAIYLTDDFLPRVSL